MIDIRKLLDLQGIWADTTKKRAERKSGNTEKQDTARKEMLRRVAEFNTALNEPTCRIPTGQTKQDIHMVDGGKKLPRAKVEVEDELSARTEYDRGPGKYQLDGTDVGVEVNISVEDEKEPSDGKVS